METLFLGLGILTLGLLATIGILVLKYGNYNVEPQRILTLRNVVTGRLTEMGPGLKFFVPGLQEIYQVADCRHIILDPDLLRVTSRGGQPVLVDFQLTVWPDGFNEEDKYIKVNGEKKLIAKKGSMHKGQVSKIITRIGEQIGTGLETHISPEVSKKNIEIIGLKSANVAIQNMVGNFQIDMLIDAKAPLAVPCPYCGKEIASDQSVCPDPICDMNLKEMNFPAGFYERMSFSWGIRLHKFLTEQYGLACRLEIRNMLYTQDIEEAGRAGKVADLRGKAKQTLLGLEAQAYKDFIGQTNINPSVAYLGDKFAEIVPELVAALTGNRRPRGEEKKGDKK